MKNFSKVFPMLILVLSITWGMQVQAQPSLSASCSTVVGSSCVGTCAPVGFISYNVSPPCTALVENLCVETTNSSLCPSHIAIAWVYVNGVLTTRGNITATGSTLGFSAPCGANVQVVVTTRLVNPNIQCVWFGNVDFVLKR